MTVMVFLGRFKWLDVKSVITSFYRTRELLLTETLSIQTIILANLRPKEKLKRPSIWADSQVGGSANAVPRSGGFPKIPPF